MRRTIPAEDLPAIIVDALIWPRVVVALTMLAMAGLLDWRQRWVPNAFWRPFVAIGAVFFAIHAASGTPWALPVAWSATSALLLVLLWRIGVFGGGDAKALATVAWLVPTAPTSEGLGFALDTLVNGFMFAGAAATIMLVTRRPAPAGNTGGSRGLPFLVFAFFGAGATLWLGNVAFTATRILLG